MLNIFISNIKGCALYSLHIGEYDNITNAVIASAHQIVENKLFKEEDIASFDLDLIIAQVINSIENDTMTWLD